MVKFNHGKEGENEGGQQPSETQNDTHHSDEEKEDELISLGLYHIQCNCFLFGIRNGSYDLNQPGLH